MAFRGDELALAVDLQRAVARVTLAARRLHREECIAADRDIKRIAGRLHRTLREVDPGCAILHEADALARAAKTTRAHAGH
jgi:hypothetical protein